MSTFSGLTTAASGLAAARRGMDVVGQNIANQKTEGYTRQRVETSSIAAVAQTGRFSMGALPGHGVSIDGVSRLGDALLDARVRDTLGASGYWATRALAATTAESALAEPTDKGLANRLTSFWAGWQDLANTPDSGAAAASILESAKELAAHVSGGYRTVAAQWTAARGTAERTVSQVNAAADQIAVLNSEIREALASGRSANELTDRRNLLAEDVARLAGATATVETDGTLTVRLGGNALVSGGDARHIALTGSATIDGAPRVGVAWESVPDLPSSSTGRAGRLPRGARPGRRRRDAGAARRDIRPRRHGARGVAQRPAPRRRHGVRTAGRRLLHPPGHRLRRARDAGGRQHGGRPRPRRPGAGARTRPTPTSSPRSGGARPLRTHCGPIR